jgi:hypothetical protein
VDEVTVTLVDIEGTVVSAKRYAGGTKQQQLNSTALKLSPCLLQLQTNKGIKVLKFINQYGSLPEDKASNCRYVNQPKTCLWLIFLF